VDLLRSLHDWYAKHCDGQWEHRHGIKIESCDNPGWWVKVDLVGTELESCTFSTIAVNVDDGGFQTGRRWMSCRVENGVWHGAGDETKLSEILGAFLTWATGPLAVPHP
jgi:hypothetical protein